MESKHIPGEWSDDLGIDEIDDSWFECTIYSGNKIVAKAIGPNIDECTANAKLISAAPDLLEALKELSAFCQSHKMDNHYTDQAEIAIRKAEGI